MSARESFVTSGPRIKPRIFCGAGLPPKPADARTLVEQGYKSGVPMVASCPPAPWHRPAPCSRQGSPGANLDRIQIVKGWVDAKGEPRDKVIDVAWSGQRKPGQDGKVPAVATPWT